MKKNIFLGLVSASCATLALVYFLNPYTPPAAVDTPPVRAPVNSSKPAVKAKPLAKISAQEKEYFKVIALAREYGDGNQVVKWTKPKVTLAYDGNSTAIDRACVADTLRDFNNLSTEVELKLSSSSAADIKMHFKPESEFKTTLPEYIPINMGYFYVWWSTSGDIQRSVILIDSTSSITQAARCHLIREELTQSMGLPQDSLLYSDSIFQAEWTETIRYSSIDKAVIRILYGGYGIKPSDDAAAIDLKLQPLLK